MMSRATRRIWIVTLAASVLLPTTGIARDAEDSAKVYQTILKSIVWIHSARDKGRVATGSGTLIDKQRRLVLTNYHVVGNNNRVTVLIPAYRGTNPSTEREYYTDRLKRDGG